MKPLLSLILMISSLLLNAQVRLPSVLSSGMVLQRDTVVNIWGWAGNGERVEVEASWLVEKAVATTGADGKWITAIPTGPAGGPHTITVRGANTIVLTDILFGEVWICSGQSNMEFTINWLGGWKHYRDAKKELARNDYGNIRLCNVSHHPDSMPSDSCSATWKRAGVKTVADFSATAWFFGRELYNRLGVPVGLIATTIGGTPAEAWTPRECLQAKPELSYFLTSPGGAGWDCGKASYLYNGMIHPLMNYRIRGAIWYQGESNRLEADLYTELMATMIGCWRKGWRQGNFPFYFVQIAPFDYRETFGSAAYLREAQEKTLTVPNTGMAVTMDIGDVKDIHPKKKQEVGFRLAMLAMTNTYGKKEFTCTGPVFKTWKAEGRKARVFFDGADEGLFCTSDRVASFTMAGPDGVFHNAAATLETTSVLLSSDKVDQPAAIRFAFTDTALVNLFNLAGFPAAPFRTDTIPFLVRPVKVTVMTDPANRLRSFVLSCPDKSCQVRYTLNGSDPDLSSPAWAGPVPLDSSVVITASAFKGQIPSAMVVRSEFRMHLATGKKIAIAYSFSDHYPGGPNALLDGIRGSTEYRDGAWQGYHGVDLEGVIDLGASKTIRSVSLSCLNNPPTWIFLPESVTILLSEDGINFTPAGDVGTTIPINADKPFICRYRWGAAGQPGPTGLKPAPASAEVVLSNPGPGLPASARYIKIAAKNRGVCPKWHQTKGGTAWLFADEVVVE